MILAITIFLAFLFYKETLLYYFISDDFISVLSQKNYLNPLKISPFNNHYTPVNDIIDLFLFKTFGTNPFPFHLFAILVHLLNIYLVYKLTKLLIEAKTAVSLRKSADTFSSPAKREEKYGIKLFPAISALLFTFFFSNYEVVYWFGATNNSLMVSFYLISLIFLIKYVKSQKNIFSWLFQLAFTASFLTHEYALSLIPVGIIYWFLFTKKKNPKELTKLFLFPLIVFLAITVLKILFVKIALTVRTPSLLKFIAFTLRSFVYLLIPNPFIIDKVSNLFIPLIFLIILFFLIRLTKNKQTLFLLLWTTITIFIYSLTSAPQARYFYLSSIPIIIYIVSLANIGKAKTTKLYLLFILISGIIFLQNQKYYWKLSSQITKNVIRDLKKYSSSIKKTDTVYFVNLPDSSNDSIWKAYVFRAGFKELLNNFADIHPKKIVFLTSFQPTPHTIEASYVKPDRLKLLSKENKVFVYNEELKTILPAHP